MSTSSSERPKPSDLAGLKKPEVSPQEHPHPETDTDTPSDTPSDS
ncbi:hypothetical protein GCM10022198_22820 [Klugiella xanthotipulae]|uniref:Uncharacterized protein n=1 Tax=Klugiella xanthotipulae TaxID=244735 RepID=A0A543HYC4_9MICO|nr:hypothetical protein [Klugiella xanthotipulae]TQM63318.1 hypothetical protein FB466_1578 [Klugiella xanthotipulae]